ncbi:Hypothetical protein NocV09_11200020 [Nannochloropsis oceanica]
MLEGVVHAVLLYEGLPVLELKAMVTSLFLLSPSAGCLVGIKERKTRESKQEEEGGSESMRGRDKAQPTAVSEQHVVPSSASNPTSSTSLFPREMITDGYKNHHARMMQGGGFGEEDEAEAEEERKEEDQQQQQEEQEDGEEPQEEELQEEENEMLAAEVEKEGAAQSSALSTPAPMALAAATAAALEQAVVDLVPPSFSATDTEEGLDEQEEEEEEEEEEAPWEAVGEFLDFMIKATSMPWCRSFVILSSRGAARNPSLSKSSLPPSSSSFLSLLSSLHLTPVQLRALRRAFVEEDEEIMVCIKSYQETHDRDKLKADLRAAVRLVVLEGGKKGRRE